METYHKIQTLFKRDMTGELTGKKGKMMEGEWTTPELEYLADKEWEFTEKVDGTNIRVHFSRVDDNLFVEYGGRTDNAVIPKPLLQWLKDRWPTSLAGDGSNALAGRWMVDNDLHDVTLYGEGYGPKIQGGGKYRDDTSFVLFDVKIGDFWLSRENVDDVAAKLGIESVPVLGTGTLHDAIHIVRGWRYREQEIGEWVDVPSLRSEWGDFEAEGIVARPVVDLFNRKGERIICKIKAVDFR